MHYDQNTSPLPKDPVAPTLVSSPSPLLRLRGGEREPGPETEHIAPSDHMELQLIAEKTSWEETLFNNAALKFVREDPQTPLEKSLSWWSTTDGTSKRPRSRARVDSALRLTLLTKTRSHVIHTYRRADVLSERLFSVRASRGVVPQKVHEVPELDLVITVRRYVEQTLADLLTGLDLSLPSKEELSIRLALLRQVLDILEPFHSKDLAHGDVRPENVGLSGEQTELVDYLLRVPLELLTAEQQVYVAPEAEFETQPASDVFSFGKMAQRLLGSYLWDDDLLPSRLGRGALKWILDFSTLADPDDRPTVPTLISVLLEAESDLLRKGVQRALTRGRTLAKSSVSSAYPVPAQQISLSLAVAEQRLRDRAMNYPETSLSLISARRVADLLGRITIDANLLHVHNPRQEALQMGTVVNELEQLHDIPENLDAQWMDRLHRAHFGFGITVDHDERLPQVEPGSPEERKKRLYLGQVEGMTRIRREMLARDTYLYTAGVIELMTYFGDACTPAEVHTLRRWGDILAVPDHGRWLYPLFQFDPRTGGPYEAIGMVGNAFKGTEPWDVLSWWYTPRANLGNSALADCLSNENGTDLVKAALSPRAS